MKHHPAIRVLNGERLSVKDALFISKHATHIELAADARQRCVNGRTTFLAFLKSGECVYGVNVGVGALKDHSFEGDAREAINRSLVVAHSAGIRDVLPEGTVRLAMLLRLNVMLIGRSGCSVELIDALANLLNAGITPVVRGYGSVGCGDILINGQVGHALTGHGMGSRQGVIAPMAELLAQAGLTPHQMQSKDAISMVSNNVFALAESMLLAERALRALDVLLATTASSAVALGASATPWSVAAQHGRGHAVAVGQWLSSLNDSVAWQNESTVHDPLSIRFLAEIYGALYDELDLWVGSIEDLTDFLDENPVLFGHSVVASGGSHLLHLAIRTDAFRIAIAHALRNAYNLCSHMISGRRSGVNVNLIAHDSVMTGFGPFLKVAGALTTKACSDATPVSPMALVLANGLEDESTHLPLSLEKLKMQIDCMEDMIAVMALMSAQALDISAAVRPAPVETLYQTVRAIIPFSQHDQALSEAVALTRQGLLAQHQNLSADVLGAQLPLRSMLQ